MASTKYPIDNRALNRATCSRFIERSRDSVLHPCHLCPNRRITRDKDDWGYVDVCPCGSEKIPEVEIGVVIV